MHSQIACSMEPLYSTMAIEEYGTAGGFVSQCARYNSAFIRGQFIDCALQWQIL